MTDKEQRITSALSRADLAADTIARAKDVDQLNDAAWEALEPALIAMMVMAIAAFACFGLLVVNPNLFLVTLPGVIGVWIVGWPKIQKWRSALSACDAFAQEMRQMRKLLEEAK